LLMLGVKRGPSPPAALHTWNLRWASAYEGGKGAGCVGAGQFSAAEYERGPYRAAGPRLGGRGNPRGRPPANLHGV